MMSGGLAWRELEDVIDLPPELSSARRARLWLGSELSGFPASLIETAALLVSELTANAVIHARTAVSVEVHSNGEGLVVAVSDASPQAPRLADEPASPAESGRGLRMVEALADAWGVREHESGKTIWFYLARPTTDAHRSC
jgi:anti-sigma regulatory factor (Ser/Thr protein kinase)